MNKLLNVGIIGLGVGRQHIKGYELHPDCKVASVCDWDTVKLNEISEKYPSIILINDSANILFNPMIHVVSIASYDNHHYPQVITALENDKHVFVEKPLCLNSHHARLIKCKLTEKPNLKLYCNLPLRTSPRFNYLKQLINNNEMGDIYYIEGDYLYGRFEKIINGWRGKVKDYSAVLGGGIHMIDLMMWLTGKKIPHRPGGARALCHG